MAETYMCYHGTIHDFKEFSTEHFGEGTAQYGDGFYFGDTEEIALQYSETNGFIITADVTLQNPIHVNADKHANMRHIALDGSKMADLLKYHPDIYRQPGEEPINPLGDYAPDFWYRKKWTMDELDNMIASVAKLFFNEPSFLHVENFFGEHTDVFHKAVRDVMGFDGIVVDWPETDVPCGNRTVHKEAAKFIIAWFPEQIRILQKRRVIPMEPPKVEQEYRRIMVMRCGYATVPANTDEEAIQAGMRLTREEDWDWESVFSAVSCEKNLEVVETCNEDGSI